MSRKGLIALAVFALVAAAAFPSFWYSVARLVITPVERLFGASEPQARLLETEPASGPVQSAARRLMQPLGAVRLLRQIDDSQR